MRDVHLHPSDGLSRLAEPIGSEPIRGRDVKLCPPDRLPREGETIYSRVTRLSVSDYCIDPDTGCWNWNKSLLYGYAHSGSQGGRKPYHLYWERANGPMPDGYEIHHVCRNPRCINPDHLEAVHPRDHDIEHFLGERAGGLTLNDVRRIRELGRLPGADAKAIARDYGIAFFTVYRYWGDQRWMDFLDDGPVVMARATCALEGCSEPVSAGKRGAKFCGEAHRSAFNRRKPEQKVKAAERQRRYRAKKMEAQSRAT